MNNHRIFIANWKMNMPFNQALHYIENYKNTLVSLVSREILHSSTQPSHKASAGSPAIHPGTKLPGILATEKKIVICPSFAALDRTISLLSPLGIGVGAQNCSEHARGAYTGEVDALSLYQLGCRYCIVGHSERRLYYGETDEIIAQKVLQLIYHQIIPIICIGENKETYDRGKTIPLLTQQLRLIFEVLTLHAQNLPQCYIAYEPIWAIGTGVKPEHAYLTEIITWLSHEIIAHKFPTPIGILYGGSVDATYASNIAQISALGGFLIGSASLDFQKFANIVLLE